MGVEAEGGLHYLCGNASSLVTIGRINKKTECFFVLLSLNRIKEEKKKEIEYE